LEEAPFAWCGKRFVKDKMTGEVKIDMSYHQNFTTIPLNRERRKNPADVLNAAEIKKLKGLLGSLQWLTAHLRMDISFGVSSLQSEKPTVGTVLRANKLALQAKKHSDFTLTFRDVNIYEAGILVVTDAALGNVTVDGVTEGTIQEKVLSQSCYAVLLAYLAMWGSSTSWTFGAIAFPEFADQATLLRCWALRRAWMLVSYAVDSWQLWRINVGSKMAYWEVCRVMLVGVTDAKDVYDRLTMDTSFSVQKSLAFTVAAFRQQLRRPRTSFRLQADRNCQLLRRCWDEVDG
jgi:hypothetical protein